MQRYATVEKAVGETPLEATERLRTMLGIGRAVPLAYAGRLDPMASGRLLILIGDECKRQQDYHALDKEYRFEVLFGVRSDTGDVLGLVSACDCTNLRFAEVRAVAKTLTGPLELPYPHFSSKTVDGKPLHTWTLEGRLNEITIPTRRSTLYRLALENLRTIPKDELHKTVLKKIETIPPITDARKALGRDFRRDAVRASWLQLLEAAPEHFPVATLCATCSSGTYMRSLAEVLADELNTCGLAYSIHRSVIGRYRPVFRRFGFWSQRYTS